VAGRVFGVAVIYGTVGLALLDVGGVGDSSGLVVRLE